MYYWYDFSYDEIAEILSLTLSAVKKPAAQSSTRVSRSLDKESVSGSPP